MGTKLRQSNIELLRIISMLMILMVHFTGATFPLPPKATLTHFCDINSIAKILMESFSIIGVNCFVLISGYFGIKPSVKGVVNFILWCAFYSVVIYAIYTIAKPTQYNILDLIESFGIFSHTDLWFIPAYFALYIIAPIINKGIADLKAKPFILLLCGLTFINVYLGWGWSHKINPTVYNVMQLIYIYIIGRFLKVHISRYRNIKHWYIVGYFASFLLITLSTLFCKSTMAFAYNSPFVISASIFFFLIFTSFRFYSPNINFIASSAFAVYLIHKMPPIWNDLKNLLIDNTKNADPFTFTLFWVLFIALIFSSCITIDKFRELVTKPLSHFITKQIKRII